MKLEPSDLRGGPVGPKVRWVAVAAELDSVVGRMKRGEHSVVLQESATV